MRKDFFYFGLSMRILMVFIFLVINETTQYNDASLIIYKGFVHLFKGENPYSYWYELNWGTGTFSQPLNYGPLVFIVFLPAMLLPFWYRDLWIGMAVMINVYAFLTAQWVSKWGSQDLSLQKEAEIITEDKDPRQNRLLYYGGLFYWMIPLGTTSISVFIYAQIFLCTLAFIYREKPLYAGLFLTIAGLSYQLTLLFLPIYAIYYFKRNWRDLRHFIFGCIPAFLLFLFFVFWQYPAGTIDSLFLYSSSMPYEKCSTCGNNLDRWSIFSIPRLLYNWSAGQIQVGNYFRLGMIAILAIICGIYLFTHKFDKNPDFLLVKYQILAVILFTLTTNYGQSHYLIFLFIPLLYYFQIKKPDFRKQKPIGGSRKTQIEFEPLKLKGDTKYTNPILPDLNKKLVIYFIGSIVSFTFLLFLQIYVVNLDFGIQIFGFVSHLVVKGAILFIFGCLLILSLYKLFHYPK